MHKKLRIFHGPVNVAGIGGYMAQHQRDRGYEAIFITHDDKTVRQNHDRDLKLSQYHVFQRLFITFKLFCQCLKSYDLFHFYLGKSFFIWNLDLPVLKLFGKKMVMTYCGSDIRLFKDVELKRNPYAGRLNYQTNSQRFDNLKKTRMWWHNLWIDKFFAIRSNYANACIVIPKEKVVKDIYINNTMDIHKRRPRFRTHDTPLIVHAPHKPEIKGTVYVEKAIDELRREGLSFHYRRIQNTPNDEAQRIYHEEADIIVDQLYIGSFGSLAVEGMYYGLPVCCYLMEDIVQFTADCPIVNTSIETIKEVLRDLILSPEKRLEIGRKGRAYVEKYFDRQMVGDKVIEEYLKLYA